MAIKLNIAEILKDCPKGMELDSPVWDNIVFDGLEEGDIVILRKRIGKQVYLTQYGAVNDIDGKCVIFPKGKRTWDGFARHVEFGDGDVVATNSGIWIGIVTGGISGQWCPTYCAVNCEGSFAAFFNGKEPFIFERPATEDEKASLFKAIKEAGFVWNAEAKKLEKVAEP